MNYLTVQPLERKHIRRLFSKINVDKVTGCWLWNAGLGRNGYGKVKFRGRTEVAHRLMWAWLVGPLPSGQRRDIPNLDHIVCDTPRCCFPGHLKLVLPRENTLRSAKNPTAINARKTHCPRGHLLPSVPSGTEGRVCQVCRDEWHKSDRYRKWNADFGQKYHQAKRYGPDREAFLKRQREYMRAWHAKKKDGRH